MAYKCSFSYNRFNYEGRFQTDNQPYFKVESKNHINKPKYLFKYYAFYDYNVEAILNHYLFASDHEKLNDTFDCFPYLLDVSKLSVNDFIEMLEPLNYKELKIKEMYYGQNEKKLLIQDFHRIWDYKKSQFYGIISLSSLPDNVLMWSYYTANKGFVIKLECSKISKPPFFGPFPINYSKDNNIPTIDYNEYEDALCFLYQTNVKYNKWKHEHEWRYLGIIDNGFMNENFEPDINKRKLEYDSKALKEIILGHYFFEFKEIALDKRTVDTDTIILNPCNYNQYLKILLLDYVIARKLPVYTLVWYKDRFEYAKRKEVIIPLESGEYKFKHGEILRIKR